MSNYKVRQSELDQVVFKLIEDNSPFDLTSITRVNMIRVDSTGTSVTYASDAGSPVIVVTDAADGEVTLTPPDTDFWANVSWYDIYFQIEFAAASAKTFPRIGEIRFEVT